MKKLMLLTVLLLVALVFSGCSLLDPSLKVDPTEIVLSDSVSEAAAVDPVRNIVVLNALKTAYRTANTEDMTTLGELSDNILLTLIKSEMDTTNFAQVKPFLDDFMVAANRRMDLQTHWYKLDEVPLTTFLSTMITALE